MLEPDWSASLFDNEAAKEAKPVDDNRDQSTITSETFKTEKRKARCHWLRGGCKRLGWA